MRGAWGTVWKVLEEGSSSNGTELSSISGSCQPGSETSHIYKPGAHSSERWRQKDLGVRSEHTMHWWKSSGNRQCGPNKAPDGCFQQGEEWFYYTL